MPRFKMTLEYDGTSFVGWQRQTTGLSVQQILEESIAKIDAPYVRTMAAGRTDAGVHALGQVVHADLKKNWDPFHLARGLNHFLRDYGVCVVHAEQVNDSFHARFSATRRSYVYKIINRPSFSPLNNMRMWHIPLPLDVASMIQASQHLMGTHDFSAFRAQECQAKSPIKTLEIIDIQNHHDTMDLFFYALSFLHHQVRNIVGTLAWVGLGKIHPDRMMDILVSKDRRMAGPTAPPWGLYFRQVEYERPQE